MAGVYIDETVSKVQKLHHDILQLDKNTITIHDFILLQAQRILEAHSVGNTAVLFHLACWCKPLIGKPKQQIMDTSLTLELAQQTIAAEHGYSSWSDVKNLGSTGFDAQFEACIDHMLSGETGALKNALETNPEYATQRSQYGHQATLLHYLGANGVESYRQVTPLNAADLAQVLIDAGADPDAMANIYGGSTTVELLVSSAHPNNAGVVQTVKAVLEKAGGPSS